MNNPSLTIVGCGDLGTRLALQMIELDWTVYGARRNSQLLSPPIKPITLDLYSSTLPVDWPDDPIDYLVFCVAPNKSSPELYQALYCQGLTHLINWLQQSNQQPKQLIIISSTAVYGQTAGEWLDETSPTEPTSSQGQNMLAMEQIALQSGLNTCVIRLAGIYGPNRNYLIRQAKAGVQYPPEPPLYANRIHIDDAVLLIKHLLLHHQTGYVLDTYYIGVDDNPAPIQETLTWLRKQLAVNQLAADYAVRTTGSKRLINTRAKTTGWQPHYPSYKEGYLNLLS